MVQELGNNMMIKINIPRLILLVVLPVMLTACSDNDDASEKVSNVIELEKMDSISLNQSETINTLKEIDLQDLMQQVAEEERQADKYGFVWSTTDGLIKKAKEKAKEGNESEAKVLFQEAILQYRLSIEQAKYANLNWKLLLPQSD